MKQVPEEEAQNQIKLSSRIALVFAHAKDLQPKK
jgi:hypothetical protein